MYFVNQITFFLVEKKVKIDYVMVWWTDVCQKDKGKN